MPRAVFVCILLLFLVLTGCTYRYHGRIHHIVKKKYEPETLYIPNYIFCVGLYRESLSMWEIGKLPKHDDEIDFHNYFDTDSIFKSFLFTLDRMKIPVNIKLNSLNTNYCDETFLKRRKTRFKDYQLERILEIIGDTQGKTILFPVIFLENRYRSKASGKIIGGEVMGGGGLYIKQFLLNILVLVVQDNEIVYMRAGHYFGDTYYTGNKQNPTLFLEQKHWDRLVKLVMKDYIKRLETNHDKGGDDVIIKEEPTKDYWQKY